MTRYRCNSDTCEDNGGVCVLIIPEGYEAPTSCVNPESFTDNGDEPDCIWKEESRQQGKPEEQLDPCIEQGCDDIENCDEICKHRRELHQQGNQEEQG